MKNNGTYSLYRGSADNLEKLRPTLNVSGLRILLWRSLFTLLFAMTAFTLIVSFLDDEILVWIFGLFSDNQNFIREGATVFLPVYQIALVFFLIVLVAINMQCIRIRQMNQHLLEQENLIREMLDRLEE